MAVVSHAPTGLDDEHQSKGADDEHQQRGQERVECVGHNLANLTLHPGEKRTSDESRDHATRCRGCTAHW